MKVQSFDQHEREADEVYLYQKPSNSNPSINIKLRIVWGMLFGPQSLLHFFGHQIEQ